MLGRLFENHTPLDLARACLLSIIGLSWSIVISVGGYLIVQTYGEDVRKGPPFADQAMAVAQVLESTPAFLRPEVLRALTSNFFDVSLQPNAVEPSPDNFQASMLTFRFLTQSAFSDDTARGPGAMGTRSPALEFAPWQWLVAQKREHHRCTRGRGRAHLPSRAERPANQGEAAAL